MKNPYWNRKMIKNPKNFFGRKKEVKQIFSAIKAPHPQSVSITGERKIGKSSLLYYILRSSKEKIKLAHPERYIFAFYDFQQYLHITVKGFWKKLYPELKDNIPSKVKIKEVKDYDTFTEMVKTLDVQGYKLILLFDEFDKILENENFGEGFFSYLRSLANRYDIAYIVSTQKDLELSREDVLGSPFFNIFTPIRLGLFQKDEASDLITRPSAEEGIPLEENKEFILKNAGLFPFFIQLLCHKLYRYKEKHDLKIDREGYNQVLEEFREEATSHFNHFWRNLSQEEKEVLVEIARGRKMKKEKKFVAMDLKQKGYITIVNGRDQIFSDTFRQFILDHQKEVTKVGKSQTMKQRLYKTISGYSLILKWIFSILSIILLSILSNWVYERFFLEENSPFITVVGKILSIFSPISSWSFFITIAFLLIIISIVLSLSKR